MAEAVESALRDKQKLIVEAGTGTGKTLAYLVPALLSGKRVVVSTNTKALQEQLFFKDIPFLRSLIAEPFAVCYMKGRANYLCRQKFYNAEREPVLAGLQEIRDYTAIREWETETETGDRSELVELPDNSSAWWKMDARSEMCAGQKCKQFERCFITMMHQRAAASDIIVVNHHLFFADLAVRTQAGGSNAILPEYSSVIFDEAHEIEDVAGQYFGISVSNLQMQELAKDTAAISRRKLFASPELDRALVHLGEAAAQFFTVFPAEGRHGFRDHEKFLQRNHAEYAQLLFALDTLDGRLELVTGAVEEVLPLSRRAKQIRKNLEFWVAGGDAAYVYWTEARGRGVFLQATPIDVSQTLQDHLMSAVDSVILTSATLTVSHSFEYAQARLGLPNARTLQVQSPFEYPKQALLYVPQSLPDPRQPEFARRAADEIERILEASRGRAFVLFTSYAQMHQVHRLLDGVLDHPMLLQGEAPRTVLLDRFRSTPGAVLFATSSFWQGIDVQGEQLSCVIIDRLPFASPGDPIVAARVDAIRRSGGNAFYEYQIPDAALALKQGFGRLIRSASDRGVLVLLDNRITKQRYGKVFLESLPSYGFTTKIEDVQNFFNV